MSRASDSGSLANVRSFTPNRSHEVPENIAWQEQTAVDSSQPRRKSPSTIQCHVHLFGPTPKTPSTYNRRNNWCMQTGRGVVNSPLPLSTQPARQCNNDKLPQVKMIRQEHGLERCLIKDNIPHLGAATRSRRTIRRGYCWHPVISCMPYWCSKYK